MTEIITPNRKYLVNQFRNYENTVVAETFIKKEKSKGLTTNDFSNYYKSMIDEMASAYLE